MLVIIRLSGTAANSYNQERAFVQTLACSACAWPGCCRRSPVASPGSPVRSWSPRRSPSGWSCFSTSGLRAAAFGGDRPANIADHGEDYERFYVTGPELASAAWLGRAAPKRHLVYADRYGQLRYLAATGRTAGLLLRPDARARSTARPGSTRAARNVRGGRARGQVGSRFALYRWPQFVDGPLERRLLERLVGGVRPPMISIVVISKDERGPRRDARRDPRPGRRRSGARTSSSSSTRRRAGWTTSASATPTCAGSTSRRRPASASRSRTSATPGSRIARGDTIVFTDAGCDPRPGWLAELLAPHRPGRRGRRRRDRGRPPDGRPALYDSDIEDRAAARYLDECPTINMAFRRAGVRAVGGFDESFEYGSDIDFSWRRRRRRLPHPQRARTPSSSTTGATRDAAGCGAATCTAAPARGCTASTATGSAARCATTRWSSPIRSSSRACPLACAIPLVPAAARRARVAQPADGPLRVLADHLVFGAGVLSEVVRR